MEHLSALIVDIGNFSTIIGNSADSLPIIDTNSFVLSSDTISEETTYFAYSNDLCFGKKHSDVESIFELTEEGTYPKLKDTHF